MMRQALLFTGILIIIIAGSCNVQRYLPAGEKLYKGATVKVEKPKETTQSAKSLAKTIKLAANPKPNKFLFGQPYKVWFWYKIGEPKREKGLKAFFRNKLGEPPVLSSRVNAKTTAENMQSLMENLGYFHTTVQGDTTNTGSYFMKAHYTAQVQPRYSLDSIKWVGDTTKLMKLLERTSQAKAGVLKKGNPYTLSDITAERSRLDLVLKQRGYYFFNPDYIMAYADSTVGNHKVNLYLNIKKTTPEEAKYPYKINDIRVFADYTLSQGQTDTLRKSGFIMYDSLKIKDPKKKFKPSLFAREITYRPGRTYSSRQQNTTLNRLINLGSFKFVKNTFEPVKDSTKAVDTSHRLNALYYLTPAKKKSLQAEIDGFTKENNYIGTEVSVSWKNRNAFRGAEQLSVRAYGGIETTSGDSIKNNNFRLGTEVGLKIPKYAVPFFRIKESNFYPPNTNILFGYEYYRRDILYTKNSFRFDYSATWKPKLQTQWTVAPFSLNYQQATNITDSFRRAALINPSLNLSVFNEVILGSYVTYTYNSGFRSIRNKWYFSGGMDLSGNIYGLATGAKDYRSKTVFGTPFAQYVKFDLDLHYTRKLTSGWDWANRIALGIGLPYNNSRLLPFSKLYTIGGSSSIRGFQSRTLGPGSYKPTAADQRYFQLIGGDYKLLMNTELRIPLTKQLSTAVFIDAGNIWTKDTLLFGPAGKFTKDFLKEIAVAGGVGLRFDATVLLIRVDLGVPLVKPYLPEGKRLVIDQIKLGSAAYRREDLILNIAIGLPF